MFTLYIEYLGYLFAIKPGKIVVNDNSMANPLDMVTLFDQMIELYERFGYCYPCASGAYEISIADAEEVERARQEAQEDGGARMFDPGPLSYNPGS